MPPCDDIAGTWRVTNDPAPYSIEIEYLDKASGIIHADYYTVDIFLRRIHHVLDSLTAAEGGPVQVSNGVCYYACKILRHDETSNCDSVIYANLHPDNDLLISQCTTDSTCGLSQRLQDAVFQRVDQDAFNLRVDAAYEKFNLERYDMLK